MKGTFDGTKRVVEGGMFGLDHFFCCVWFFFGTGKRLVNTPWLNQVFSTLFMTLVLLWGIHRPTASTHPSSRFQEVDPSAMLCSSI